MFNNSKNEDKIMSRSLHLWGIFPVDLRSAEFSTLLSSIYFCTQAVPDTAYKMLEIQVINSDIITH